MRDFELNVEPRNACLFGHVLKHRENVHNDYPITFGRIGKSWDSRCCVVYRTRGNDFWMQEIVPPIAGKKVAGCKKKNLLNVQNNRGRSELRKLILRKGTIHTLLGKPLIRLRVRYWKIRELDKTNMFDL